MEIKQEWVKCIPKIIAIAKEEDNLCIDKFSTIRNELDSHSDTGVKHT